jgi:hypothetical protein
MPRTKLDVMRAEAPAYKLRRLRFEADVKSLMAMCPELSAASRSTVAALQPAPVWLEAWRRSQTPP